jgi:hypothetical protein
VRVLREPLICGTVRMGQGRTDAWTVPARGRPASRSNYRFMPAYSRSGYKAVEEETGTGRA